MLQDLLVRRSSLALNALTGKLGCTAVNSHPDRSRNHRVITLLNVKVTNMERMGMDVNEAVPFYAEIDLLEI